jgi:hypothetical protein
MTFARGFGALVLGFVTLDDETIFLAVEKALQRARSLAGADIAVCSREGFVTLSGFALTMRDIATAGRIALRVRGVTSVRNEIRVADPSLRRERRRLAHRASRGAFLDYVRSVFAEHSRRARALGVGRANWLHRLSQRQRVRIRATNLYARD